MAVYTKEECLKDINNYPWAADMADTDKVSDSPSYDPSRYYELFEEKLFPSGDDTFGDIRYYLYDPTKHGFEKGGNYPLIVGLHGMGGAFAGRDVISWTGLAVFASEKYQREIGGAYILIPVANEIRDENGETLHSWMTAVEGKLFDGYTDDEVRKIKSIEGNEYWVPLLGHNSVYTDTLHRLVDDVCTKDHITGKKIVLGASAGGYAAWRQIISRPREYAGALIMAGAYLPSKRELKILEDAGLRIWIAHSRRDECVDYSIAIEPILEDLRKMHNTELYLPEFVRRADGNIASNISGMQMGQHCINDVMQENALFLDGTPMDKNHPDGVTGWIKSII